MPPLYFSYHPGNIIRRIAIPAALALCPFALLAQQAPEPAPADAGATEPEQVFVLDEYRVESTASRGNLKVDETLGAMRINTSLIDSPISVAVLTGEFVGEFMLEEVDDQLSYVAGGSLAGERQSGTGGYASFRGFQPQFYRNGFQRIGIAEVVNLERIEFIKGPLAATFGLTEPGGIVNYITQRPYKKRSIQFKTQYGTFDYQRYEAHINTGAFGPGGKVFGRFDVTYADMGGFQDFTFMKRLAASAAVTWQPTKNTSVTIEFERLRQDNNRGETGIVMVQPASWTSPVSGMSGVTVTGGINANLVREGFNPLGPDYLTIRKVNTLDVRVEHRINGFMSLRVNLQWWERPYERWIWSTTSSLGSTANYSVSTGNFNNRDPYHDTASAETKQGQIDLLTAFKLGPTAHKFLFTVDFSRYESEGWGWKMHPEDRAKLPASVLTLNSMNPDFSGFDKSLLTRLVDHTAIDRSLLGYLFSDRMAIGNWGLVFASLRYDHMKTWYENLINTDSSGEKISGQWSHSYGGNFRLNGNKLVVFGNYSTSFTPSTTRDRGTGELQDNINASGYEMGFKGEMLEGKAYWTLSAYRIDRKNIPQLNPNYSDDEYEAGRPQYIGAGWERNDGLELEVYADPHPGLSIKLAGSYMDARTRVPAPGDEKRAGKPLLRVPRRAGSAAVSYTVQSGLLRGLKFGASARYTDDYIARYGIAGNQVTGRDEITGKLRLNYGDPNRIEEVRPTVTLYDAYISYWFRMGKYRHLVGLRVKNIFNEEWWSASGRKNDGRTCYVYYDIKF